MEFSVIIVLFEKIKALNHFLLPNFLGMKKLLNSMVYPDHYRMEYKVPDLATIYAAKVW